MATALTFLPAMLGFLGPRGPVPAGTPRPGHRTAREPGRGRVLAPLGPVRRSPQGSRRGRRPWPPWSRSPCRSSACGLARRTPAPTRPSSTTHQAYAALAEGFGPGFNGPLELVARSGSAADVTAFDHLLAVAAHTPGVASVTPAVTSPNGKVLLATVYPTTSPQATQTVNLVNDLRDHLIPRAGRRHQPGRPRRRGHGDQHRLRPRADRQAADLHRHRRAPGVPAADGRLPQPADPAGGLGDEPAVRRRRPRRHERGLQLGLGRLAARPVGNRAGRRVHPGADVLRALRPVHGLRGLPDQPHPRRMAPPAPAPRPVWLASGRPGATTRPSPPARPRAAGSSRPRPAS